MRSYTLTDREVEILKRFVASGEKLNGFTLLIHYLKKNSKALHQDLALIDETFKKLGVK